MPESTPLLDLLGALSLATDAAAGFPRQTALRTSIIAFRLARACGLPEQDVRASGCAGLLRYLGCTGAAHEGAAFSAGSDAAFLQAFADADFGSAIDVARRVPRLGARRPLARRLAGVAKFLRPGVPRLVSASHCEVADQLSETLGVDPAVRLALRQMYERHDGRGQPGGLSDLEISTPAQVLSAAQTLEVAARAFGVDGAIDVFQTRRGSQFAPAVADAFLRDAHGVLRDLDTGSLWNVFRESEPLPRALVSMDQVDDVARAFAHFTDVKSTFTLGHSVMVAELALAAADGLGAPIDRTALERAALLHDIGRVAVENAIWDKPGPLDPMERTAAESHSFETERILRSSPLLAPLIDCIGVHERLDGRGYHRRVPASEIGMAARLLAACDVWCALVSDRPQRRAYPKAKAVATLGEEARAGRLDRDAVRAVIEATGGKLPKLTRELVAGLSEREIDVVALLARGLTNKQIGVQLRISEKTAKNHVAAIYAKTGVTTRAGAALFASQHGLVGQGRASEK